MPFVYPILLYANDVYVTSLLFIISGRVEAWPPRYLHIQYPVCFVVVIICKVSPRKS